MAWQDMVKRRQDENKIMEDAYRKASDAQRSKLSDLDLGYEVQRAQEFPSTQDTELTKFLKEQQRGKETQPPRR